ncbi:MAG TPA: BrnT family toxin [Geminicoccaceae bacterium]
MRIEFDPEKDRANRDKHGVPLAAAAAIFMGDHAVRDDRRFRYGERREIAYGLIAGRLHVCVFTRRGERLRVISLRRANGRERRAYAAIVG